MTIVGVAGLAGSGQALRVRRRGFIEPWSATALVVLVLASYGPATLAVDGWRTGALAALGLMFSAASLYGVRLVERRPSAAGYAWLFAVPLLSGAGALLVSGGLTMMSLLATLSLAVIFGEGRGRALVLTATVSLIGLGLWLYASTFAELAQGAAGMASLGAFVGAFSHMIRTRDVARADLAAAHEALQDRSEDLAALAAERERLRIAREIHDSVGHWLTAAHVHLETARALVDEDTAGCRAAVDGAQRANREALAEVRESVRALRVDAGPSLESGLRRLAREGSDVALELELPGALSAEVEHTLLRVAQEALSNARRHAEASRIALRLEPTGDGVALTVTDDGVGFDPVAARDGSGLSHMRERVEDLGGRLLLDTAPGDGVRVRAEVPA